MNVKKNLVVLMMLTLIVLPVISSVGQASALNNSDLDVNERVTSSADIIERIEQLSDDGEVSSEAVRPLKLHLTAIGQFEKQEDIEKIIRHMDGFHALLDHQYENQLLSIDAYQILKADAENLTLIWDSLHLIQDGETQAVVVAPVDQKDVLHWGIWNGSDTRSKGYTELALDVAHSGDASAVVLQMERGVLTQRIELDANNVEAGPFEFSVYFYTAFEGDAKVRLETHFRDENYISLSNLVSEIVPTADTAGEWHKLTLHGEVPETVNEKDVATIQAAIHVLDGQDQPVYVDDVRFFQTDENGNLLKNPGFEQVDHFIDSAHTLIDYVQKSTGVTLPIVTEENYEQNQDHFEGLVPIYVGTIAPEAASDMEDALLEMNGDGFFIHPEDNTITIIGPTPLGIQNGVYDFLERFVGVRWLAPGEDWEHVPELDQLSVPNESIKEEPDFPFRSMNLRGSGGDYTALNELREEWNVKNRMQNPQQLRLGHNLFALLRPEKYGESNPEFYPNGTPIYSSSGWQPCFTEEGTIDAVVGEILDFFERNPGETSISLAVNDRGGYCEANSSHPDYPNKTNSIGLVDMSDIYYDWVNQVVERVLDVYPDKWFGLYAYQEVMDPPSFPVHPRVVPVVTKDRLAWIDDEIKDRGHQQTDDWNEVANITGWYEYLNGPHFFVPRLYPHIMAENYRYAKEKNVLTHHGDNHPSLGDFSKMWISAKLQWDVDQDVDFLLQDWYEAAVGPEAAPDLAAYEAIWENFWTHRIKDTNWFALTKNATYMNLNDNAYLSIVTDEEIQQSRQLLESVIAKAETPEQQVRAEQLLQQFEFYEASALSYPREIEQPQDEEDVLALLDGLPNKIDQRAFYLQKRQALHEQFDENLALQYPFPYTHPWIQVTWEEWSREEVEYVVDYIREQEPSGGPVSDRLQQLVDHDSEKVRAYAADALTLLNRGSELGDNLLVNPGFEELLNGFPVSWNRSGQVDVSTDAHTGDYSIQITDSKFHQNVDPVESGQFYQFSGFLKCEQPRQIAFKVEYFKDAFTSAGYLGGTQHLADIGEDWTQALMDVRMPSETNKVQVFLLTDRAGAGTCYFDDASFNKYE